MPIDKQQVRESDSSRITLTKMTWMMVVAFVISLAVSFLLGIWTYYIVEFFMKGWHLLAG